MKSKHDVEWGGKWTQISGSTAKDIKLHCNESGHEADSSWLQNDTKLIDLSCTDTNCNSQL
jgi:hypothetical protein